MYTTVRNVRFRVTLLHLTKQTLSTDYIILFHTQSHGCPVPLPLRFYDSVFIYVMFALVDWAQAKLQTLNDNYHGA